jgi:hypothetical protein
MASAAARAPGRRRTIGDASRCLAGLHANEIAAVEFG